MYLELLIVLAYVVLITSMSHLQVLPSQLMSRTSACMRIVSTSVSKTLTAGRVGNGFTSTNMENL